MSDVHDDRIHDENAQCKRRRRDYIASKIGTGPQPLLETIKYQVSDLYSFLPQAGLEHWFCNNFETKLINMPYAYATFCQETMRYTLGISTATYIYHYLDLVCRTLIETCSPSILITQDDHLVNPMIVHGCCSVNTWSSANLLVAVRLQNLPLHILQLGLIRIHIVRLRSRIPRLIDYLWQMGRNPGFNNRPWRPREFVLE